MKKQDRLNIITTLIQSHRIGTQNELLQLADKEGVHVTQATLSRDLQYLGVMIIPDGEKGHIYSLPGKVSNPSLTSHNLAFPVNSVQSIGFSGNLAILRCAPSFAPSIALILDDLKLPEIMGTIAGDDTVLIVISEDVTREQFQSALRRRFPKLEYQLA